ncbi:helicase HerA domain-containing protein [Arcobacter aquimarinus]|uniref:helicase HerA domain-containing protein n=1 Tax=Arcobacter aquimarinus TaxID=1315211 RepID=UPI003BAEC137
MSNTFDYEKLKLFYIGKEKINENYVPLVYKNKDLLTHAAIIGMTGSGKTGLGISLLEEAAIDNIPSIIIDPKGDMTNLLLTFPNLNGSDFEPWIEEQDAINNGLNVKDFAQKTADLWKNGLEKDFQSANRVEKLKNSADFTIYTPGSNAGVQISILSSFKAPSKEVLEDNDLLVSLINSTVSSILSLIDEKNDSSSKESILISSIFMNYFLEGKDLSLEELITLIVTPPFSKIGIFDLETFFAQADRLKLALKLNTIIANPAFKTWIEGETLDISNLLYDESGKAKVSIFSIAHLNDSQRMFFVSLLLNQMVSWMRRQEGTTSLKALLYMDEIFGYFPPNSNPPSKLPMLTLLKQARSFGIGIILSTQNPVDIDYKGLANIGTWFIGRLQTKQDKEKVIDGLSSANEGNLDKNEIMNLLSNLEKRNFILKNINEDGIKLFQTRWALSYLKGPIPKEGIKKLMAEKLNSSSKKEQKNEENHTLINIEKSIPKPIIPNNLSQKYHYSSQNSAYYLQPYLICSCDIHYVNASKDIDLKTNESFKIYLDETIKEINFDEKEKLESNFYDTKEKANSFYYEIPSFIQNERELKSIEKSFADYVYRNSKLTLFKNDALKITSKQDESLSDFKIRLQDRLNEKIDLEVEKLQERFKKENDSFEKKLNSLYEKLQREQQQATSTTTDTIIAIGTSILGAFFGRSSTATTIGKVATSAKGATKILKEKNDVKQVENEINQLQEKKESLKTLLENEIEKINSSNLSSNYPVEEIFIKPKRSDIYNIKLELLWKEQL